MDNKNFEYISYNYDPFNRAVMAEIARQNQISESLRSQTLLNKSLILLRWAGIAALLIVSVSFAIWLLKTNSQPRTYNDISSSIDVRRAVERVGENVIAIDSAIKTKFTVFETFTTDTGKQIVTGHVYEPDSLDSPNWQYCYLSLEMDSSSPFNDNNNMDILMRTLANKSKNGDVTTITKNENYIQLAKTYCRFI